VAGEARLTSNGFLAVAAHSSVTVKPGGTLEFGGSGGFYEGVRGADNIVSLVNDGTILKSGEGTTSVIGTDYAQTTGDIEVSGGTLAFKGGTEYSAEVDPGQRLSTEECATQSANSPCTTGPGANGLSVAFTVPTSDADGAPVRAQELPQAATTLDPKGVGQVFLAHADDLEATPQNPAIIEFRLGMQATGTTNLAELGIVHVPDAGPMETLPDCLPTGLPPSGTGCVDKRGLPGSSRIVGQDAYLIVRTTTTSRYVCHKELIALPPQPPTPPDVTAPTITLATSSRWKDLAKAVTVTAAADEASTLTVSAEVMARKQDAVSLRPVSMAAAAGQVVPVTLKLKRSQRNRFVGAKKVKIVVTIRVTDAAGNASEHTFPVKLT